MPMEKGRVSHTTDHELLFISRLGTQSDVVVPRKQLLANYIAAANKRTDWGAVKFDVVIAHAQDCLAKL